MFNQYEPLIDSDTRNAVIDYINSGGWITEHKKTTEFENPIAEYVGVKHCVVVDNATNALFLSLKAFGIGRGDEVIVPDLTMVATANAVVLAGAKPIFVDIDQQNLCLSVDKIEQYVTKKTKAIIYVSLNGRTHLPKYVKHVAESLGLHLIEDAAQSLGSRWKCKPLGTTGEIGVFSFSVPKIITTGGGGAIVTDNDELAQKIRLMKNFGRASGGNDDYSEMGWNFKFTDLQAAAGIGQFKSIDARVDKKRHIYKLYQELLDGCVDMLPTNLEHTTPWFVDIYVDNRDELEGYLHHHNIGTRTIYPTLHSLPFYSQQGDFGNATEASSRGLWLPSSMTLLDSDIEFICNTIRECVRKE